MFSCQHLLSFSTSNTYHIALCNRGYSNEPWECPRTSKNKANVNKGKFAILIKGSLQNLSSIKMELCNFRIPCVCLNMWDKEVQCRGSSPTLNIQYIQEEPRCIKIYRNTFGGTIWSEKLQTTWISVWTTRRLKLNIKVPYVNWDL